mgnify:CR=1 FL=1
MIQPRSMAVLRSNSALESSSLEASALKPVLMDSSCGKSKRSFQGLETTLKGNAVRHEHRSASNDNSLER